MPAIRCGIILQKGSWEDKSAVEKQVHDSLFQEFEGGGDVSETDAEDDKERVGVN